MTDLRDTKEALIAAIADALGFVPQESVVAARLDSVGEASVVVRMDLEDSADPDVCRALVAAAQRADSVREGPLMLVALSDHHHRAHAALETVKRAGGVEAAQVETVAIHGHSRAPAPPGRVALWQATSVDRSRARRAARQWAEQRPERDGWRLKSWERWDRAWEEAQRTGRTPDAPECGRIAAGLLDVHVRDAVVVALVPGGDAVAKHLAQGHGDHGVSAALDQMTDAVMGIEPDPVACDAAVAVATAVAGHGRGPWSAPACTIAGVVRWWQGRVDEAGQWIDEALDQEPGYRLAELLRLAIRCSVGPGWLRQTSQVAHSDS